MIWSLLKNLDKAGIAHSEKTMGSDHTYQFWVTDPDGNRIEIQQYTDRSAQITGLDVGLV